MLGTPLSVQLPVVICDGVMSGQGISNQRVGEMSKRQIVLQADSPFMLYFYGF